MAARSGLKFRKSVRPPGSGEDPTSRMMARSLKRGLAAVRAQFGGLDPDTGELKDSAVYNLKQIATGSKKRITPGLLNEVKAMGSLPSQLAPLLPGLLAKFNPISSTAADDTIRPPPISELARGTPLANAYAEAEPEGDQTYLENLLNFAPPQWAEQAEQDVSRTKELALQEIGLEGPPESFLENLTDAAGTMTGQIPSPVAWLRRLKGIRAAAEATGASRAARTALGGPLEYFSPTIDPTVGNYANGTVAGAIGDYLGGQEEAPEPEGHASGGAITTPSSLTAAQQRALLTAQNRLRMQNNQTYGSVYQPPVTSVSVGATPFDPLVFRSPDGNPVPGSFPSAPTPTGGGGAPTGIPTYIQPVETTPRQVAVPQPTGFVPQPNMIPEDDSIPLGNDTLPPTGVFDVGAGVFTPIGPTQTTPSTPAASPQPIPNPAPNGGPVLIPGQVFDPRQSSTFFNQQIRPGEAPPQPRLAQSPTRGAGIYGPSPGSTAPPQRVGDPRDPQWWLTYGFGPEQNFYSMNNLPSSGVPGGG